jgi:succinate dehydrogenase / fumarate reductase iron-sulfur subunit
LRNFPLISDLVVDVSGLYRRLSASEMEITRTSEGVLPLSPDGAEARLQPRAVEPPDSASRFNRFESCIECGICLSACPTMAADDRFLGPAGLVATSRARQETADPERAAHLMALAGGEHGVWRCHGAFECTEACPQAVDPAGAITGLRRELLARRFSSRRGGRR